MSDSNNISLLASEVVTETPFLLEEEKDIGAVLDAMDTLLAQRARQNNLPTPGHHDKQTALVAACARESTRLLEDMEKCGLFLSPDQADQMAERIRDLAILASTEEKLSDNLPVRISRAQQAAAHRTTEFLNTNPTVLPLFAHEFRQWQNGPSAFGPAGIEDEASLLEKRIYFNPALQTVIPKEMRDAAKKRAYRRSAGFLCTEMAKGKRILPSAQLEELNPLLLETFAKGGLYFDPSMEKAVKNWEKHLAENSICFMVDALKGQLPESHPQNDVNSIQEIEKAKELLPAMFRRYNAIVIHDNHGGCIHDISLVPSSGLYEPAEKQNLTYALKTGASVALLNALTVGVVTSGGAYAIGEICCDQNFLLSTAIQGLIAAGSLFSAMMNGKKAFHEARNSGVSIEPDRVDLFAAHNQPHDRTKKSAAFRTLEQRI